MQARVDNWFITHYLIASSIFNLISQKISGGFMKQFFKHNPRIISLLVLLILITLNNGYAQNIQTARVSPQAEVKQQIGISTVTINYSRPAVNGREVWGSLVPYGLTTFGFGAGNPAPWRAGANENNTVTFSHDTKVNGKVLKAGIYGLHLIVNEKEDWVWIFSKDNQAWGSFFYDEKNDAIRVSAKPEDAPMTEWLTYGFDQITRNSAKAFLQWEKKRVGFIFEFPVHELTMKSINDQLTSVLGFSWQAFQGAAVYTFQSNKDLEQGEKWIRRSIAMNENANNRNMLGYMLKAQNKMDEAMKVFKENIEKYPTNWNVYDSYGEALNDNGDKNSAIKYFKKALEMAPQGQKERIEGILEKLKS
jgi:hypothetical protein